MSETPDVREVVLVNDDRNDPREDVLVLSMIGEVVMVRIAKQSDESGTGAVTRTTVAEMFVSAEAFGRALSALGFTARVPADFLQLALTPAPRRTP